MKNKNNTSGKCFDGISKGKQSSLRGTSGIQNQPDYVTRDELLEKIFSHTYSEAVDHNQREDDIPKACAAYCQKSVSHPNQPSENTYKVEQQITCDQQRNTKRISRLLCKVQEQKCPINFKLPATLKVISSTRNAEEPILLSILVPIDGQKRRSKIIVKKLFPTYERL